MMSRQDKVKAPIKSKSVQMKVHNSLLKPKIYMKVKELDSSLLLFSTQIFKNN